VQSRPLRSYKKLLAACLVSLFLSTASTYFFFKKWSEAEDWYRAERITKDTLSQKCTELQIAFDRVYNDLSVMHNENNTVFFLQAADSTKRYFARVYWNRFTHQTFIDIQNMPASPEGKAYQLWAHNSAKPVDAGLIRLRDDRLLVAMKNIEKADRWSVTVEPSSGSLVPDSVMFLVTKP
jgi:hypothetical protein